MSDAENAADGGGHGSNPRRCAACESACCQAFGRCMYSYLGPAFECVCAPCRASNRRALREACSSGNFYRGYLRPRCSYGWHWLSEQLGDNFAAKVVCVLLMVECAFIALTARGVITIISAVVGVIFAIEGLWGAVKYDAAIVKRFLVFLVFHFVASIVISVVELQTINPYCESASSSELAGCISDAERNGWLSLGAALIVVPLFLAVQLYFYRYVLRKAGNLYAVLSSGSGGGVVTEVGVGGTSGGGAGSAMQADVDYLEELDERKIRQNNERRRSMQEDHSQFSFL